MGRVVRCGSVVERMVSRSRALGSIPSTKERRNGKDTDAGLIFRDSSLIVVLPTMGILQDPQSAHSCSQFRSHCFKGRKNSDFHGCDKEEEMVL